jgi:hypothetical protein
MSHHCPCPLVVPVNDIVNPAFPFRFGVSPCAVQITFIASDELLACIYRDIAAISPTGAETEFSTNISAHAQLRLKNCKNLVKIIPGQSPNSPIFPGQLEFELQNVRRVLEKFCVHFQEDFVLLVAPDLEDPFVPSQIQALLYCKVDILAVYSDEHGLLVLEVSNFELAKSILANAPTAELCPQDCQLPCRPCVLFRPCPPPRKEKKVNCCKKKKCHKKKSCKKEKKCEKVPCKPIKDCEPCQ